MPNAAPKAVKQAVDVFETIWTIEPATIIEVVNKSGWSQPTVERVIRDLQTRGEVICLPNAEPNRDLRPGPKQNLYMVTRTQRARDLAIGQAAARTRS